MQTPNPPIKVTLDNDKEYTFELIEARHMATLEGRLREQRVANIRAFAPNDRDAVIEVATSDIRLSELLRYLRTFSGVEATLRVSLAAHHPELTDDEFRQAFVDIDTMTELLPLIMPQDPPKEDESDPT
ncbi:MAG: hypothetical protein KC983_05535 [Phycisphaerales bacterium]|nr:hypothetical protein [Phycisphaerales bacterium]